MDKNSFDDDDVNGNGREIHEVSLSHFDSDNEIEESNIHESFDCLESFNIRMENNESCFSGQEDEETAN